MDIGIMNENLYHDKKTVSLSIETKDGKMILRNSLGQKWIFPDNLPKMTAIASLVFTTIAHKNECIEAVADNYTITIEIQENIG